MNTGFLSVIKLTVFREFSENPAIQKIGISLESSEMKSKEVLFGPAMSGFYLLFISL